MGASRGHVIDPASLFTFIILKITTLNMCFDLHMLKLYMHIRGTSYENSNIMPSDHIQFHRLLLRFKYIIPFFIGLIDKNCTIIYTFIIIITILFYFIFKLNQLNFFLFFLKRYYLNDLTLIHFYFYNWGQLVFISVSNDKQLSAF